MERKRIPHSGGTAHISQTVVDRLIPRIIESQSLAVDTISGATNTSNAVINAVSQAIEALVGIQANGIVKLKNLRIPSNLKVMMLSLLV